MAKKGIFCLEGMWTGNLADRASVRHMLDLIHTLEKVPFIHRTAATLPELEFYLEKWQQARYDVYRILYLAFHGEPGAIRLGNTPCSLDHLAGILEGSCTNSLVVFASCSTLDLDQRHLKRFLKRTGALAVCGYREDVDWMKSYAFELLLMAALQEYEFSGRGIQAIRQRIQRELSALARELKFRMVTVKDLQPPADSGG